MNITSLEVTTTPHWLCRLLFRKKKTTKQFVLYRGYWYQLPGFILTSEKESAKLEWAREKIEAQLDDNL